MQRGALSGNYLKQMILIVKVPELNSQEWFSDHQLFQLMSDKKQPENDIPVIFLCRLEGTPVITIDCTWML